MTFATLADIAAQEADARALVEFAHDHYRAANKQPAHADAHRQIARLMLEQARSTETMCTHARVILAAQKKLDAVQSRKTDLPLDSLQRYRAAQLPA